MPLIDFTDQEVRDIVEFFNDIDGTFSEETYTGVKKLADSLGIDFDLVKCQCGSFFSLNQESCPNCGEEYVDIKEGDEVRMPGPCLDENWDRDDKGVVTGIENIDDVIHVIVLCKGGQSWFVEASRLEKV